MFIENPIDSGLEVKFQYEKLKRSIKGCNNIDILRNIALELLEMNRQKTAIAKWVSMRALDAENKQKK